MTRRAILIPLDGVPVILQDKTWGPTALTKILGSPDHRTIPASWSPSEDYWPYIVTAADSEEPANRYGRSMAGPVQPPLQGSLLVLALTREHQVASFELEDLLTIALRLLIAEATAGELESGQ